MCGRISRREADRIARELGLDRDEVYNTINAVRGYGASYNVYPTAIHPLVTNKESTKLTLHEWGMIGHWEKEKKKARRQIIARSDNVHKLPTFAKSFAERRCLIPVCGYYEWCEIKDERYGKPYYVKLQSQDTFCLAGIYRPWKDPVTNEWTQTFAMITHEPNEMIAGFHHRMPVILRPEEYDIWLSDDLKEDEALNMLQSYPADDMTYWEVSKEVNRATNDGEHLIHRVSN